MRASRRTIAVGLSIFSLLSFGIVGAVIETAGASTTPPTTVNELVSVNGTNTDPGCPSGITPTVGSYTNLPAAITAATAGNTIYVCAGDYNLSVIATYSANQDIVVTKSLTIDGPDWATAPSGSANTIDSTTQADIEEGSGILVEASNVAINGLTFFDNNFDTASTNCGTTGASCSSSIDVQSFVSGAGDQGESGVQIDNNLFLGTGGNDWQNGVVHFGLGPDGTAVDVTALDTGDVVEGNVFDQYAGFENNAVQISDTNGAIVDGNTVNYASVDDNEITALWFPGYDKATQVEFNTLNGNNIDSDVSVGCNGTTITTNCVNTDDPKSGIKFVDVDVNGAYGAGCTGQVVSNNTISGFVYDVSMISSGYDPNPSLCLSGPAGFTVSDNTVSNSRLYGIFIYDDLAAPGTISGNSASNSDTEGFASTYFDLSTETYTSVNYTNGEYDYFDQDTQPIANTWSSNQGNGSADPSSIGETSTTTTTTTTTTLAPKPSVSTSAATLKGTTGVSTTVFCAGATCTGTLELTKTVVTKVKIGKTKKYKNKTTVVNLGKARYSVAAGQAHKFTIRLNATGLKMAKAVKGKRYTCTLVITTSAGTTKEGISFKKP